MKYSLHLLDKLIGDTFGPENGDIKEILTDIKETVFSLLTEAEIRLYIKKHQNHLALQRKMEIGHDRCDKVLHFIETYFYDFTDDNFPLSNLGKEKLNTRIAEYTKDIRPVVEDRLDPGLLECINPIIFPETIENPSIHTSKYVMQFWNNWKLKPDKINGPEVINYLIFANYNAMEFFMYLSDEIFNETKGIDDPTICEQIFEGKLNQIKSIPEMVKSTYEHNYPNIKGMIVNWLRQEITNCRTVKKSQVPNQLVIDGIQNSKFESTFSVAQLSYFFKLLKLEGIITNEANSQFLALISKTYTTSNSDSLSYKNLYNKYFDVEQKTKDSIEDLLTRLIKRNKS